MKSHTMGKEIYAEAASDKREEHKLQRSVSMYIYIGFLNLETKVTFLSIFIFIFINNYTQKYI